MSLREEDDDLREYEFPEPDDEEDSTYPCPYCRTPIFDEAEQCPKCGNYISREDEPDGLAVRPWWIIVGLIVSLAVALMWILP